MPRFRPVDSRLAGVPITLEAVCRLAAEVIAPPHFFVAPDLHLEWTHLEREETSWEVFRSRLLDPAHTRERAVFEAWSVYETTPEGRSAEPVLSLKLDAATGVLHVVRGLECYVWEGYDSGGGVFLSRERRKWVRELVATLRFDQFADLDELRDEMICGLYHAVVGASRLPLTSVEAPLPAFSFGRLFYCFREEAPEATGPLRTWREMLRAMLRPQITWTEQAHLLETILHSVGSEGMVIAASEFILALRLPTPKRTWETSFLLKQLFNGVSLSPWTNLTEKLLAFLQALNAIDHLPDYEVIDFLGYMLRQICRHLTSYDLVTFHHRGANYPDALLLDAVLKEYLDWAEKRPELFDATDVFPVGWTEDEIEQHFYRLPNCRRQRRRALRQSWVVRRRYEGHPVPDSPTSPGENNRVLPASHPRVPEEQILQTNRRTRRLYDGDPLPKHLGPRATEVFRQSISDLSHPAEVRELGNGLFLDRPLGADKVAGEADASPLFASVAFSRSIAVHRLNALAREEILAEQKPLLEECLRSLMESPPRGLPLERIGGASRPGAVSLADARLASPDFEFVGSTSLAVRTLCQLFGFNAIEERLGDTFAFIAGLLFVRNPTRPGLLVYDDRQRVRMELDVDRSEGLVRRAGVEYPASGLLVTRVWEETADGSLREHDFRAAPVRLRPR